MLYSSPYIWNVEREKIFLPKNKSALNTEFQTIKVFSSLPIEFEILIRNTRETRATILAPSLPSLALGLERPPPSLWIVELQ